MKPVKVTLTMKPVKVTVTKKDIKNGTPGDCSSCPVALATARACKVDKVEVSFEEISLIRSQNYQGTMRSPKKVSTFVERFDNGQPVKPMTFVFRDQSEGIRE